MKKRLVALSVLLAVLMAVMTPAAALAAKPQAFSAAGTIGSISPGTVFPAGNSGRWRVVEREAAGVLTGDISGPFTMAYKANVESVFTQAGNFHGTLTAGSGVIEVNGKIAPLELVPVAPGVVLPRLTLSGKWTLLNGGSGQGDFQAWVIFIPTAEGHVGTIVASYIVMTGQWQPAR